MATPSLLIGLYLHLGSLQSKAPNSKAARSAAARMSVPFSSYFSGVAR